MTAKAWPQSTSQNNTPNAINRGWCVRLPDCNASKSRVRMRHRLHCCRSQHSAYTNTSDAISKYQPAQCLLADSARLYMDAGRPALWCPHNWNKTQIIIIIIIIRNLYSAIMPLGKTKFSFEWTTGRNCFQPSHNTWDITLKRFSSI